MRDDGIMKGGTEPFKEFIDNEWFMRWKAETVIGSTHDERNISLKVADKWCFAP